MTDMVEEKKDKYSPLNAQSEFQLQIKMFVFISPV